jgi:hypothetical protein
LYDSDTEAMEDNTKLIEELLERATEYGKTSLELLKLKALDKTSDVISSFLPNVVVFFLVGLFMLFFNIGLAFWLGEILGKICYGFFVVAAFYGITGIVLHFFLPKWLKKQLCDYINKQVLK